MRVYLGGLEPPATLIHQYLQFTRWNSVTTVSDTIVASSATVLWTECPLDSWKNS